MTEKITIGESMYKLSPLPLECKELNDAMALERKELRDKVISRLLESNAHDRYMEFMIVAIVAIVGVVALVVMI